MPDETLGMRLCGVPPPAPALTAGPEHQMGPVRVRTPSPRRVAFCVVVACLCCQFALCLRCVSPCEEGSLGRSAQPGGVARVLVGRIIAGLRAPPRAGRPRQGRKVSVHEVCDRQRVVGWSSRPPNRDSSHPTAKPRGGQGVLQGSAAA